MARTVEICLADVVKCDRFDSGWHHHRMCGLHNGDLVEVMTNPGQRPFKDWLDFVVTSRARSRIRSYLRQLQREKRNAIMSDFILDNLANDPEIPQPWIGG